MTSVVVKIIKAVGGAVLEEHDNEERNAWEGTATPRLVGGLLMAPLKTEVLAAHLDLVTGVRLSDAEGLVLEMDVRRGPWRSRLGLPRGVTVHWADVRTVDIKELSAAQNPIRYRLTYGDGWYVGKGGRRQYFPLQPHLVGIDLERRCTEVAIRASVLAAVVAGIGLRCVGWVMWLLFHFELSKSSLDRWVKDCADQLPDAGGMARALHADKPITEANFDEIFGKGQRPKRCTLVLRDEHGRIFAARQVEERTEESVTAFLTEVKGWGIVPRVFYVDGCEAYRKAIRKVFPDADIQYDYFHVIQNIWKKLKKVVVARRKEIKAEGEAAADKASAKKLLGLAQRIWEHRWLFLKRDENLTAEERVELLALLEADATLAKVRGFAKAVWNIFEKSESEPQAQELLQMLMRRSEVVPGSVYQKAVTFLQSRFDDMVCFLRHGDVRRNSLAETGIRCLRRLERGHDGFRGAAGLDCYLRIYQAVKYCGWTVYRSAPGLGLPAPTTTSTPKPVAPDPATG